MLTSVKGCRSSVVQQLVHRGVQIYRIRLWAPEIAPADIPRAWNLVEMYALGRAQNLAVRDTPDRAWNITGMAETAVPDLPVEMAPLGLAQTTEIDTGRGITGQPARAIPATRALPGDTTTRTTGRAIINMTNTTTPIAAGIITPATRHCLTPIVAITGPLPPGDSNAGLSVICPLATAMILAGTTANHQHVRNMKMRPATTANHQRVRNTKMCPVVQLGALGRVWAMGGKAGCASVSSRLFCYFLDFTDSTT